MTVQVFTNYSAPTMPMYGQPGYMPMNYGYPSLFMSGGCMPPMVGGCYDTFGGMGYGGCCCGDGYGYGNYDDGKLSGMEKGLLIGAASAVGVGLIVRFAKPIGQFFSTVGKGIWSGLKWTGNMIAKGAKAAWSGIKWVGKKIGQGASWLWNNTLGRLFKKKDSSAEKVSTADTSQNSTAKTE